MKFIFIRHAESEGNKNGILAGPEVPLSEEGLLQSQKAAEQFTMSVDVLYASPWRRTLQTADAFAKKLNLPINIHDDIHEKEYGSFTGRRVEELDQIKSVHPEYFDSRWGWNYTFCGGESPLDARQRLLRFVDDMKQKHAGQTILALTHAGFIRVIHCTFGNHEQAHEMPIKNLSVHEFDL